MKIEPGDEEFLGPEVLCLSCVMEPCICEVRELEMKLEKLKLERKIKELEDMKVTKAKDKKRQMIDGEETDETQTPRKRKKTEMEPLADIPQLPTLLQHSLLKRDEGCVEAEGGRS